jgi:hypothetical protein
MQEMHLVLHGVAIKKHAPAEAVAELVGLPLERVKTLLAQAVTRGRLAEVQGKYLLTPTARMALDSEYSRWYSELREQTGFIDAYEAFERVNNELKALITDWQTLTVGGQRVPNDHSNAAYDEGIIGRLGDLHERADKIFSRMATLLPRLGIYRQKLGAALEKAEDGELQWVSDVRIESYHTVWFELHEDLLRILGRQRQE